MFDLVSRPYIQKYSMESFLIAHTDRTPIEGVQRRVFVRFDEKIVKMTEFSKLM